MGASPMHSRRPAALPEMKRAAGAASCMGEVPMPRWTGMTLARASRLLLAFAATLIVVWSFFDVGRRAYGRWALRHEKPITLTVMHWGDQAEDQLVAKLLERYARENPRVQIIRINPGNSDYRYKLKTMM